MCRDVCHCDMTIDVLLDIPDCLLNQIVGGDRNPAFPHAFGKVIIDLPHQSVERIRVIDMLCFLNIEIRELIGGIIVKAAVDGRTGCERGGYNQVVLKLPQGGRRARFSFFS